MSYTPLSARSSSSTSLRRRVGRAGGPMLVGLFMAAVLALVIGGFTLQYQNVQTQVCTVNDKDRTKNSDGDSDARIYTNECGVLSVSDLIFAGKFNSADTYSDIEVGKTYEFETSGYRIGFLSMFPVIRNVQEVTSEAEQPTKTEQPTDANLSTGDVLTSTEQVEAVPTGTLLRDENKTLTFERVADGFQVVGSTDVKPADYVASFAPLTVTYLP